MPGLTRDPGEGRPRIVQQPLALGLPPMPTTVISRLFGLEVLVSHFVVRDPSHRCKDCGLSPDGRPATIPSTLMSSSRSGQ